MLVESLMRNKYFLAAGMAVMLASAAPAATFGRVVAIGGHAADIALDEPRGVLYIADFTASRIDVMSLANYSVARSISVAPYPASLALSPDGRWLVVAHYGMTSGGQSLSPAGQDELTAIDLTNNQRRTFGLPSSPLGVAFGADGLALVLTQSQFLLFDPLQGTVTVLAGVNDVLASISPMGSLPLPVQQATFPPQIVEAALTATPNGKSIYGIVALNGTTSQVRFSYSVTYNRISAAEAFTSSPSLGPRVISTSADGSYYMTGWALFGAGYGYMGEPNALGPLVAQWPNTSGALNVGSVAIRSSKSLIYAQIIPQGNPPSATNSQTTCLPNGTCVTITSPPSSTAPAAQTSLPPTLLVMDADNLAVRDRILIPENLAGRSVFSADQSMLYSISDSGVTVFPMAQLDKAPRVLASVEDVVFRGNFCSSTSIAQQMDVVDPAGNATDYQICVAGAADCNVPGITISPAAGVTPAHVKITVDPTVIGGFTGTKAYQLEIRSASAVNMPPPPPGGATETYVPNVSSRVRLLLNNRVPENRGTFINVPGDLVDVLADPVRNRFYVLRQDKNQVQVYDSTSYNLVTTLRTSNTPTQMAMTFDQKYLLVGHNDSQLAYRWDLTTPIPTPVAPIVFPLGHYPRSIAASGADTLAAARVAGTPPGQIDRIDFSTLSANPLPSLGAYQNSVNPSTTLTAAPNGGTILAAMPDGNLMLYDASVKSFTVSRKDYTALQGSYAASSYGNFVVDHYLLNKSLVEMAQVVATGDSSSGFAFVDQDGMTTAVRSAGNGYIERMSSALGQQALATGIVEAPLVTTDPHYPFSRTLAPLADRSAIISLTTSGFTVLPWNFDAATAPPNISQVVNAADFTSPVAPGGLISLMGDHLSPLTMASTDVPLPTVLADSCLTVNGAVIPMMFASPTQINAQLPFQVAGSATMVLHTPGGVSDAMNVTVLPSAPSVFQSGTAGPLTGIPTVVRAVDNDFVTAANPIHPSDVVVIYLTGMGQTTPAVNAGAQAPLDPLSIVTSQPTVTLGGVALTVQFAGLTPGLVGVYQINVAVPFKGVPTGFDVPLNITQGGSSTSIPVRVVN